MVGESPLRNHRHSWRQQIFLRVATPQKGTDTSGRIGHTKAHTFKSSLKVIIYLFLIKLSKTFRTAVPLSFIIQVKMETQSAFLLFCSFFFLQIIHFGMKRISVFKLTRFHLVKGQQLWMLSHFGLLE